MLFLKENALSQVQSMTGCHLLFSKLARLSPLGRLILISLVTQEVINIPSEVIFLVTLFQAKYF